LENEELIQKIEVLKDKLSRAQRRVSGLREKSKVLEMQYHDSREREGNTNELVKELLERQRELNVMLNRANIMLNRTQEAMALSSMEMNEMVKALPEPKKEEWSDRVSKVNELFKKTGIQDAEIGGLTDSVPDSDSLDSGELHRESQEAFGSVESIWDRTQKPSPPQVEAEPVSDEDADSDDGSDTLAESDTLVKDEVVISQAAASAGSQSTEDSEEDDELELSRRRKSWWQKITG